MKIFEEMSVDAPTVQVTPLERDPEGSDLLERLASLESQKAEAEQRAMSASRPLPSLIARADDLAARSLAGSATAEEAEAAEDEVRKVQANIEAARREARQCGQAITLVRKKLEERSRRLYQENAEHVREAHRALTAAALHAQQRAATLLRILREFEMRYACYTDNDQPEPYPRYLRDADRTQPPRSIMGPAKSPNGHVYASSDATAWMQRAAALVDADGPAVVEVQALDFEAEDAAFSMDAAHRLPPNGPAAPAPGSAAPLSPHSGDAPGSSAENVAGHVAENHAGDIAEGVTGDGPSDAPNDAPASAYAGRDEDLSPAAARATTRAKNAPGSTSSSPSVSPADDPADDSVDEAVAVQEAPADDPGQDDGRPATPDAVDAGAPNGEPAAEPAENPHGGAEHTGKAHAQEEHDQDEHDQDEHDQIPPREGEMPS
jgi:hypothetical protein